MTSPEPRFDHHRLRLRRARAGRMADPDAGFLMEIAERELLARLSVVNRSFRRALVLLSGGAFSAGQLADLFPGIVVDRHDGFEDIPEPAGQIRGGAEAPAMFDLVLSLFGLHWSNDLPALLARIRAAMVPDGLFMAVLPGAGTLAELRHALLSAESREAAGAALRVGPFADIRQVGALLQHAGFALPVVDQDGLALTYPSARALMHELRAMGATNVTAGEVKPISRPVLDAAERTYAQMFPDGSGRIRATVKLIYMTGWSPHESQQRPLRPGSAEFSLARVLRR